MKLRTLMLIVTGSSFCLGLSIWLLDRASGSVVPHSLLNQVTTETSRQEVGQLLGEPTTIMPEGNGGTGVCWRYERWPNPGWVDIQFDGRGQVEWVNDESVFPGFP